MRILHIVASLAESDGGPTTAVLGLHGALSVRQGVESTVLSTDAEGRTGRLQPDERSRLTKNHTSVHIHPRSRPRRIKNSWSLLTAVWQETSRADLLYVHGVYLAHNVWAMLAALRWRRPYVLQPHGTLEPYQARQGRVQKFVWDLAVGRLIIHRSAALVAASEDEKTNLSARFPESTVIVVPLGASQVDPRIADLVADTVRPWLELPRHQRVLFLGRLARKKQPELLIDAWNQLSRGKLLIIGPDDEWSGSKLRSRLSTTRSTSTTFLGQVDPTSVRWFMKNAGIFVLPSRNENFGIAVAEAMAGGAAVITTAQTAASEHVLAADAGIVLDSPESRELARSIDTLMTSPQSTETYGSNGKAYAATRLSWGAAADSLMTNLTSAGIAGGSKATQIRKTKDLMDSEKEPRQ